MGCDCRCHERVDDFVIEVNSVRHPANIWIRRTINREQVPGQNNGYPSRSNYNPSNDGVSASIDNDLAYVL